MRVKVYVDKLRKEEELEVDSLGEVFSYFGLQKDSFIVVRNSELITLDTSLEEGDSLKLLSVISGG
tara:strand:- start:10711 stop:10908 length:198 start_codon:yes stop_codon:yes gene_type:complete